MRVKPKELRSNDYGAPRGVGGVGGVGGVVEKREEERLRIIEEDLVQASKELVRYLEEFPEQDLISKDELGEWMREVLLPLGDLGLLRNMCSVCERLYPGVIEKALGI
jgi:hypothetical protein